jgi:hypothetical protein
MAAANSDGATPHCLAAPNGHLEVPCSDGGSIAGCRFACSDEGTDDAGQIAGRNGHLQPVKALHAPGGNVKRRRTTSAHRFQPTRDTCVPACTEFCCLWGSESRIMGSGDARPECVGAISSNGGSRGAMGRACFRCDQCGTMRSLRFSVWAVCDVCGSAYEELPFGCPECKAASCAMAPLCLRDDNAETRLLFGCLLRGSI